MNRRWAILVSGVIAATTPLGMGATETALAPAFALDAALFATPVDSRLATAAAARGLAIAPFASGSEDAMPAAGDAVCGLVTLLESGKQRQWLVTLRLDDLRPGDSSKVQPLTIHTSSGSTIEFGATAAAVDVAALGPVADTPSRPLSEVPFAVGRAVVNREFLALGFDRACRTTARLKSARDEGRVRPDEHFSCSVQPYPPEAIAVGRDIVARAGLTPADERAFAATFPALMAYVEMISHTRGLKEILAAVIERPSIWSLIVRFGRLDWSIAYQSAFVARVDAASLGFPPELETHQLPFVLRLNDKPALECILVVAPPRPPLLTSAGIVGLTARRPGNDERRLVIRLLAAYRDAPPMDRTPSAAD